MKYPVRLAIYPNILKDGQYQDGFEIYVDPEEEAGQVEHHEAANAEELLVFLMGAYGWYPEGYEKE